MNVSLIGAFLKCSPKGFGSKDESGNTPLHVLGDKADVDSEILELIASKTNPKYLGRKNDVRDIRLSTVSQHCLYFTFLVVYLPTSEV